MGLHTASCYRHVQTTASTAWTVVHNLGRCTGGSTYVPMVDVILDMSGNQHVKAIPTNTTKIDANTVLIEFATPQSGVAIVVV